MDTTKIINWSKSKASGGGGAKPKRQDEFRELLHRARSILSAGDAQGCLIGIVTKSGGTQEAFIASAGGTDEAVALGIAVGKMMQDASANGAGIISAAVKQGMKASVTGEGFKVIGNGGMHVREKE